MAWLVPSKSQWKGWSLRSKHTTLGLAVGVLSLVVGIMALVPREGSEEPLRRLEQLRPGVSLALAREILGPHFRQVQEGSRQVWTYDLGGLWVELQSTDSESVDTVKFQLPAPASRSVRLANTGLLLGEATFGEIDPVRDSPEAINHGATPACEEFRSDAGSRGVSIELDCTLGDGLSYVFGVYDGVRTTPADPIPVGLTSQANIGSDAWRRIRLLRPNYVLIWRCPFSCDTAPGYGPIDWEEAFGPPSK